MKINQKLTSHINDAEERKLVKQRYAENKDLFDRVNAICQSYIDSSRAIEMNRESLSSPSWANTIAYELGYQKALSDIITLLTFVR